MGLVDQVQLVAARPLHGQGGWRGEADQGADPGAYGLVDKLQAAAAGDHGEALRSIQSLSMQGADQLVEGVVAADVLATQAQLAMLVEIQRGMQGAAMARQSLGLLDTLAQGAEMDGGRQRLRRPLRQLRQRLLQGFDAAQAAA